jgi:hypothetical protein
MIYVLKIIWDYWGAAIGTYRPQYRPLSAIRYLDVNPLPTRNTLFSTLTGSKPETTIEIFDMSNKVVNVHQRHNWMATYKVQIIGVYLINIVPKSFPVFNQFCSESQHRTAFSIQSIFCTWDCILQSVKITPHELHKTSAKWLMIPKKILFIT